MSLKEKFRSWAEVELAEIEEEKRLLERLLTPARKKRLESLKQRWASKALSDFLARRSNATGKLSRSE